MSQFNKFDLGACGCGPAMFDCGGCDIPAQDLVFTWTNAGSTGGGGVAAMVYSALGPSWTTTCISDVLFLKAVLDCTGGSPTLTVTSFADAACTLAPSGCDTISLAPFHLTQTGLTCGVSFLATYSVGLPCTPLGVNGYTAFTVHA